MGLLFSNSAISTGLSYENFKETLARVTPAKTLYPAIGQIWANQAVSSSRVNQIIIGDLLPLLSFCTGCLRCVGSAEDCFCCCVTY